MLILHTYASHIKAKTNIENNRVESKISFINSA